MQILERPAPSWTRRAADTILPLPPRLLAAIAIDYASTSTFAAAQEPEPGERIFGRVYRVPTHDIWLIQWGAGSATALHDHGGSTGALYVVSGELVEHRPNPGGAGRSIRRALRQGDHRPMSASLVHEVANESDATAVSIHVYSPPLETMRHYEPTTGSRVRVSHRGAIAPDTFGSE